MDTTNDATVLYNETVLYDSTLVFTGRVAVVWPATSGLGAPSCMHTGYKTDRTRLPFFVEVGWPALGGLHWGCQHQCELAPPLCEHQCESVQYCCWDELTMRGRAWES